MWPTKAAAKLAVGDWIERVYNRRRRHSSLGMICPVEFENRLDSDGTGRLTRVHQTGSSPQVLYAHVVPTFIEASRDAYMICGG